jgi:hypothetical protein
MRHDLLTPVWTVFGRHFWRPKVAERRELRDRNFKITNGKDERS